MSLKQQIYSDAYQANQDFLIRKNKNYKELADMWDGLFEMQNKYQNGSDHKDYIYNSLEKTMNILEKDMRKIQTEVRDQMGLTVGVIGALFQKELKKV